MAELIPFVDSENNLLKTLLTNIDNGMSSLAPLESIVELMTVATFTIATLMIVWDIAIKKGSIAPFTGLFLKTTLVLYMAVWYVGDNGFTGFIGLSHDLLGYAFSLGFWDLSPNAQKSEVLAAMRGYGVDVGYKDATSVFLRNPLLFAGLSDIITVRLDYSGYNPVTAIISWLTSFVVIASFIAIAFVFFSKSSVF